MVPCQSRGEMESIDSRHDVEMNLRKHTHPPFLIAFYVETNRLDDSFVGTFTRTICLRVEGRGTCGSGPLQCMAVTSLNL